MAFINYSTKNVAIKIVYYGPGLSGKTTNLRYIYFKLDSAYRGDFICLETETERTFFFDLLPIKAGLIGDFKVHFQLMTVPGQAFYEASRKSVLKGADGLIFVADSQIPLLDANLENFDGLRRNCLDHSIDLNQIPLVFQYNKRDLNHLIPVETFNNLLNPRRLPFVEAAAINGVGVFETLREIAKLTVPAVREKILGQKRKEGAMSEFKDELPRVPADEKGRAREDMEFVSPSLSAPFEVTKIKMKSQKEIEEELEKISKEFGTKAK
ncbi:MAG: GTP-binding protein [Candidatus Aminicenantales bacterium]